MAAYSCVQGMGDSSRTTSAAKPGKGGGKPPVLFIYKERTMRHVVYGTTATSASVAILVKEAALDTDKVKKAYIDELGANPGAFVAYSLWYDDNNKCPAELAKDYLKTVLHSVQQLGIKTILIADSNYFKYLTKHSKPATSFLGCAVPSKIDDYEDAFTVFYAPNYQAAKYNPKTAQEMQVSLGYLKTYLAGNYIEPGSNIIHSAHYPKTLKEIKEFLEWLKTKEALTVDLESLGLKFWKCGISTIAFAWDKHNFVAFPVDRGEFHSEVAGVFDKPFGYYVKQLLKDFFETYTGKLIPHNAGYDFKVSVYELWMQHLQDYSGMIHGIETITRNFDDTKIIAYLATNNAVENVLGLKPLSAAFMGSYAEDTSDTSKIPLDDLLLYNGKDCLATWYVYEKYYPKMVADDQLTLYTELFKPSVQTLLQTELNGMPIIPERVAKAKQTLSHLRQGYMDILNNSTILQEFQLEVKHRKVVEYTEAAKKKVFTMDDPRIQRLEFNPNSNQQVAELLFDYLKLPILDLTDTNQPAVGIKTLKKLLHHTTKQEYLEIINALIDLSQVEKILTSFIPAFEENSVQLPDGSWRLYGNFNLGGTVSGRLSCVAPWTLIVTQRGEIPIYQIKIGDMVHTHKGNWKPVTNTIYKGLDYMVDIRLCSGKVFTCTTDHKVLLSSGQWKTIKEILNVNFQRMDEQPSKYSTNSPTVPLFAERADDGRHCQKALNDLPQCLPCTEKQSLSGRAYGNQSSEVFCLQNWRQKPDEREVPGEAPQLERGMLGLQRVPDNPVQWQESVCTSCSYNGTPGNYPITERNDSTPYRQQSVEQLLRQSCVDYKIRTQNTSLFAGAGQPGVEIKEIVYRGSTPVYDLTVQDDASYLSCGFYSHNSSDPNLTNIPSHSYWAKLIKECFGCSNPQWLFGGADFNSLEDMVSALTTRDPNKMKVYEGHHIYELDINGTIHHIRDDTIIDYKGDSYTGEQFYEKFGTRSLL